MSWRTAFGVVVLATLLAINSFAADRFVSAEYLAATLAGQKRAEPGIKGMLVFDADSKRVEFLNQKGTRAFTINYDAITAMQYERIGRPRYVAAVFISPVFLLTCSTKHYLTINYKNESGEARSVIVRLDKKNARDAVGTATAQTNKSVEQIEEK